jgi:hypothetical protein
MRSALVVLSALLLVGTAAASPPECDPELTLETPAGTYYVDNDLCQPGCMFSLWIYQETDGEPGCDGSDRVIF